MSSLKREYKNRRPEFNSEAIISIRWEEKEGLGLSHKRTTRKVN